MIQKWNEVFYEKNLVSFVASVFPMFVILSALMVCLLIIETPQALASLPRENAYAINLSCNEDYWTEIK
jgi:hypothetical protein